LAGIKAVGLHNFVPAEAPADGGPDPEREQIYLKRFKVWYRVTRSFIPTGEQQAVIEAARGAGDLKVKAFAGAGKTSTLQLVAEHFGQRRGIYRAFNREIAASAARRFPLHVGSRTRHSLAWASSSQSLRNRVSL
jgi:hypothetical protein